MARALEDRPRSQLRGPILPYDDHECAGVILLGERVQRPGARAADYLAGVSTSIPVAAPAVPFVPDVDTSSPAEREAYARLAADLFG
ncbi:hypothetical protein ACFQ2K_48120 [Streptomyces sanglieri]|uniref:Uncharacterized protein n=1 Tax=Streptomyces sanglieri TaxID=193460 RepID=A0ABW2X6W6_9ACTN